jgi:hypothetical protein
MRLSPEEVAAVKRLIAETYGADVLLRLFGSRVDDRRRGGDVDLHVEIDAVGPYTVDDLEKELRLRRHLEDALRGRRVDLVVSRRGDEPGPIDAIARRTGIVL